MNANLSLQMISAAVFTALAICLVNPFGFWMPTMVHMLVLGAAVFVFGLFSIFVFAERGGDERDIEHRGYASRAAFLAGGAVLLIAVVIQTFAHTLDPWLVGALFAMMVGKTAARWYSARYR